MKPEARRDGLLIQVVGDEVVLYDRQRHRAHHLNPAATLVWQNCDGRKTVAELRRVLQNDLNPAADEVIVWQTLDRLGKAHLLREPVPRPAGLTRRQALRRLGRTAALALLVPAVTSITAPTPLRADEDFDCDELPCRKACKDKCKTDADCPSDNPLCRLLPCNNKHCAGCMQRRCTKRKTPHHVKPPDD